MKIDRRKIDRMKIDRIAEKRNFFSAYNDQVIDEDVIPAVASAVLEYFEDVWIGRPHRRG